MKQSAQQDKSSSKGPIFGRIGSALAFLTAAPMSSEEVEKTLKESDASLRRSDAAIARADALSRAIAEREKGVGKTPDPTI